MDFGLKLAIDYHFKSVNDHSVPLSCTLTQTNKSLNKIVNIK